MIINELVKCESELFWVALESHQRGDAVRSLHNDLFSLTLL